MTKDGMWVEHWEWRDDRRPGLPWLGVFLVVLGSLILFQQAFPELRTAGSVFWLAVGVAFLISWLVRRGTASLYAGALITALALPPFLESVGLIGGPGWGTLLLGIAFLLIALVRAASGGGVGWQTWVGIILAALGASSIAVPAIGNWFWPAVLIALGVIVIAGGLGRRW